MSFAALKEVIRSFAAITKSGTVIMTYGRCPHSQLRGEHIPELDIVPYLMQAPKGRNNVAQCGSTGNDSKTNSSPDGRHKIRNSEVS
ncbi:MAG: hypothetical protein DMG31_16020 [Acidobacteria bacterium]|nr:MAG: hypothetical protein DMG31_16020 [Acidobacteriota bacterium]